MLRFTLLPLLCHQFNLITSTCCQHEGHPWARNSGCLHCPGLTAAQFRMDFLWGCFSLVEPRSHTCSLACGGGWGREFSNFYCEVEGLMKRSIQQGLGRQQIWQIPSEDESFLALSLGPSRCSMKISFFCPFSFTDFHPSDRKLWGQINSSVWVDEKATMYYFRFPERNHKFSLCRRRAIDWHLAQSRKNVLSICLNPT